MSSSSKSKVTKKHFSIPSELLDEFVLLAHKLHIRNPYGSESKEIVRAMRAAMPEMQARLNKTWYEQKAKQMELSQADDYERTLVLSRPIQKITHEYRVVMAYMEQEYDVHFHADNRPYEIVRADDLRTAIFNTLGSDKRTIQKKLENFKLRSYIMDDPMALFGTKRRYVVRMPGYILTQEDKEHIKERAKQNLAAGTSSLSWSRSPAK